jgi:iron complex outermembrane receptor protein
VELSSRVLGPGRACALAVACAISAARVSAEEPPAAPAAATEAAAPTPEVASTVAAPVTPAPTRADESLPELDEIVVVGRRAAGQAERDPTASATIIRADRFEGEAKNVAELVATAPGVAVNDYGGLGQLATISIRGATADGVLVLLDGLPLNSAAGGGVDLASIPRHWIERIEVIRGVEGAAYGAGALGGVVNVVTRAGRGAASGEATAGSFETFSGAVEGSAGAPGAWILGAASAESSGGAFPYLYDDRPAVAGDGLLPLLRENNAILRGGLLVKGAVGSAERRVDALVQLSAGRRELPGAVYHLTPGDWERDARALASLRLGIPTAREGLTLAARATGRGDFLEIHGNGGARQRGGAGALDLQARLEHRGGVLVAHASGGVEVLAAGGFVETHQRETLSASISDDLFLSRVRLGPAVRIDQIGPFSGWSGKLGAIVPLALGLSLRASGGRSFRVPSFSELYLVQGLVEPNPDLRPEKGLGADAAISLEGRHGFVSLGGQATFYDDIIFYQSVGIGLKPFNAGRTLASGVELEGATTPLGPAGVAIEGSYTYLVTEILRGSAAVIGNDLPRKPRHRLFGRASLAPRSGAAGAHLEAHFVARQFEDDANARPVIPASLIWNVGAWARVLRRPAVRAQLEVKNLLDYRALLNPLANPLPGRIVLFTVRAEVR